MGFAPPFSRWLCQRPSQCVACLIHNQEVPRSHLARLGIVSRRAPAFLANAGNPPRISCRAPPGFLRLTGSQIKFGNAVVRLGPPSNLPDVSCQWRYNIRFPSERWDPVSPKNKGKARHFHTNRAPTPVGDAMHMAPALQLIKDPNKDPSSPDCPSRSNPVSRRASMP